MKEQFGIIQSSSVKLEGRIEFSTDSNSSSSSNDNDDDDDDNDNNSNNWHSSATLTEVLRSFSSVVRQMAGYNSQRRGTASTLPS